MKSLLLAALLLFPLVASAGQLQVTCTPSAKWNDGTAIPTGTPSAFKFWGALSGQTKVLLNSVAVASCSYTWANAPTGNVCVEATQITNAQESDHSVESCKTMVAPKPAAPGAPVLTVLVADTNAYKMRQAVDGYSFVAIGKLPSGTQCDGGHSADGYSVVQRSAVTLASKFDTLPLVVFAKCG